MRRVRPAVAALTVAVPLLAASPALAQEAVPYPTRCGVGVPQAEARGYVPLPQGDVFCPLVADPKAIRSFASYLRETSEEAETDVASVGISDQFGLVRWGRGAGDGVQVSLQAGVFAQFDLDAPSFDLLNADFLVGIPITWRRGGSSLRARVYHQSSHIGDEFLLRGDPPDFRRENLSFESLELLLSQDTGILRLYAGGEYLVNRSPADLARTVAHGGAELRPQGGVDFGRLGSVRPLVAVDVKSADEQEWKPAVSVRAGLDVGRPREGLASGGRWSLLAEFYHGPSPYGQFYREEVRLVGVGMQFLIR
jgi:hypothetical protein